MSRCDKARPPESAEEAPEAVDEGMSGKRKVVSVSLMHRMVCRRMEKGPNKVRAIMVDEGPQPLNPNEPPSSR